MYQYLHNHRDLNLYHTKYNIFNKDMHSINVNQLPSRISVYLGEISNKNQDIQKDITLPISEKSQLDLYTLFHNQKDDKFLLYIKRIQQLQKMKLFHHLLLPTINIKYFIKQHAFSTNKIIQFERE